MALVKKLPIQYTLKLTFADSGVSQFVKMYHTQVEQYFKARKMGIPTDENEIVFIILSDEDTIIFVDSRSTVIGIK